MPNIKRYIIDYDWKTPIEIEIDHDVTTKGKLHRVNNFQSDFEYQLSKYDSILNVALIMLAQHTLLIAISSDLNTYGVVCELDWSDGNGQEGRPPVGGNEEIRITDVDTSGISDLDDMTIRVVRARRYRISITPHSRRFSLCISKEHTTQYAIAG